MDVGLQRVLWLLIALVCVHASSVRVIPTSGAEIQASVPSASINTTTIEIENNTTALSTTPVTTPYIPTDATSPISDVGINTNSSTTTSSTSPPVTTESVDVAEPMIFFSTTNTPDPITKLQDTTIPARNVSATTINTTSNPTTTSTWYTTTLTLLSSTTNTPDPIIKLQDATISARNVSATTINTTSNPTTTRTSTPSTTTSRSSTGAIDADAAPAKVDHGHADAPSRAQSNNTSSDANTSGGPIEISDASQEPIKNVTKGNQAHFSIPVVDENHTQIDTTSSTHTTELAHKEIKNPADGRTRFPATAVDHLLEKVIAATSSSVDKNLVSNSACLLHRACTSRCIGYLVYVAWLSFGWV